MEDRTGHGDFRPFVPPESRCSFIMSSDPSAKLQFQCPNCQQLLQLPPTMAGKVCRCAACGGTMTVPNQSPAPSVGPAAAAPAPRRPPVHGAAAAPPPPADSPFPQINTGDSQSNSPFPHIDTGPQPSISQVVRERSEAEARQGSFAPERAGMSMGVVGGLLMMGAAVVWFVVGLMAGYIFFYPPILFVIGIIALFKGILDGNVAGKRRRRRRY
jgi:hypothetical protein